jgi:hypothetical protein
MQERGTIDYLLNPWKKTRDNKADLADFRNRKGQAQSTAGTLHRNVFEKGRAADELIRAVSSPMLKEDSRSVDEVRGLPSYDYDTGRRYKAAEEETRTSKISRLLRPEIGAAPGGIGNMPMASIGAMMAAQQQNPQGMDRGNQAKNEPAPVTVNLINQSGTDIKARAGESRYDGKKQIQDIFLESLFTNSEFKQNARKGLGVR